MGRTSFCQGKGPVALSLVVMSAVAVVIALLVSMRANTAARRVRHSPNDLDSLPTRVL
ncbi:hypothetical protein ACFL1X_00730 [Candidatus Hydrogenedentota bacterium]